MSVKTIRKVRHIIEQSKALTNPADGKLNNYPGVVQGVLQKELQHEIQKLEGFLSQTSRNQQEFAAFFTERCKKRASDRNKYVSLDAMPESPANRMYWEIANVLFCPKTMRDMLAILLPEIKYQVQLSDVYSETVSTSRIDRYKETMHNLTKVVRSEIGLDEAPDISNIANFAITSTDIFDVREIAFFPMSYHEQLEQSLSENFPALHRKLYQHNPSLRMLRDDIQMFRNDVATPRAAINRLMSMLKRGNTQVTGLEYVPDPAQTAAMYFYEYVKSLSDETRAKLLSLNDGTGVTVKKVIDGMSGCVNTTCGLLSAILRNNSDSPVLDASPGLNIDVVSKAMQKYDNALKSDTAAINTKNDYSNHGQLPEKMVTQVVSKLAINNSDQVLGLLLDFPPFFYDTLLQHIPGRWLSSFQSFLSSGMFNETQRRALIAAIVHNYEHLKEGESLRDWITRFDNLQLFKFAYESLSREYQDAFLLDVGSKKSSYQSKTANTEIVKFTLENLGQRNRYDYIVRHFVKETNEAPASIALPFIEDVREFLGVAAIHGASDAALSWLSGALRGGKIRPAQLPYLDEAVTQHYKTLRQPDGLFKWVISTNSLEVMQAVTSQMTEAQRKKFLSNVLEKYALSEMEVNNDDIVKFAVAKLPSARFYSIIVKRIFRLQLLSSKIHHVILQSVGDYAELIKVAARNNAAENMIALLAKENWWGKSEAKIRNVSAAVTQYFLRKHDLFGLLQWAASTSNSVFTQVLENVPADKQIPLLLAHNDNANVVSLCSSPEMLQLVFSRLSSNQRYDVILKSLSINRVLANEKAAPVIIAAIDDFAKLIKASGKSANQIMKWLFDSAKLIEISSETRDAIAQAVVDHYLKKNNLSDLQDLMMSPNNVDIFNAVMKAIPKERHKEVLRLRKPDARSILNRCFNDEIAKQILEKLDPEDRYNLLLKPDSGGWCYMQGRVTEGLLSFVEDYDAFIRVAASFDRKGESLNRLGALGKNLTEDQVLVIARSVLKYYAPQILSSPSFNWLKSHESVLREVVTTINDENRMSELLVGDIENPGILFTCNNPEIIRLALGKIPVEQRRDLLSVVRNFSHEGVTPLERSDLTADMLKTMLESIPANERCSNINGIQTKRYSISSLLVKHRQRPDLIKVLLGAIPENMRFGVITNKEENQRQSPLAVLLGSEYQGQIFVKFLETFLAMTEMLTDTSVVDLLLYTANSTGSIARMISSWRDGQSFLSKLIDKLELPELKRLIVSPSADAKCLLSFLLNSDLGVKALKRIPADERTAVVMPVVSAFLYSGAHELQPVLDLLPQETQTEILQILLALRASDYANSVNFAATLEMIPAEERVAFLQANYHIDPKAEFLKGPSYLRDNRSALERMYTDECFMKAAFKVIPKSQYLDLLATKVTDQKTILERLCFDRSPGKSTFRNMESVFSALSEDEAVEFMYAKVGNQTVLQVLINAANRHEDYCNYDIEVTYDYVMQMTHSKQVAEVIAFCGYLARNNDQRKQQAGFFTRLFSRNELDELLVRIYRSQNLEDVKAEVISYLKDNNTWMRHDIFSFVQRLWHEKAKDGSDLESMALLEKHWHRKHTMPKPVLGVATH